MPTPAESSQITGRTAEAALHVLIIDECVDDRALDYLLDKRRPHAWEGDLWDYKRELPSTSGRGTNFEKLQAREQVAELVKDVVAFHNAYGGYVVAGIDQHADHPLVSCKNMDAGDFTIEKLNEQVQYYTKAGIVCRFRKVDLDAKDRIGLLLIPMRRAEAPVVRMARGAPERADGSAAFKKGDIFARVGDKSLPVHDNLQGLQFVCSLRRFNTVRAARRVENNLPVQDPNLIEFVGRTKYLLQLWSWLINPNAPVKVLTALGGTGKTAVAFEFCRQLLFDPPAWMQKIVWLTGKRQVFSHVMGKAIPVTRTDFTSVDDCLAALAIELGALEAEILDADRDELTEIVLDGLQQFPSLVAVDDVDSLELKDQADLFSTIQILAGRAFAKGSRFLLTSRLELGAGEKQLIPLGGFEKLEFAKYSKMIAGPAIILNNGVIDLMFKASLGSPIFCTSIIELVKLGSDINSAIKRWKGKDGEEVREFAFKRELTQLTESHELYLHYLYLERQRSLNYSKYLMLATVVLVLIWRNYESSIFLPVVVIQVRGRSWRFLSLSV
jgi:hypothetical protein